MSQAANILVGITAGCITAYILPKFIDWVPSFDIWVFLLIVGLNLTQCLQSLPTPS